MLTKETTDFNSRKRVVMPFVVSRKQLLLASESLECCRRTSQCACNVDDIAGPSTRSRYGVSYRN